MDVLVKGTWQGSNARQQLPTVLYSWTVTAFVSV